MNNFTKDELAKSDRWDEWSTMVCKLLDQINKQQSEELKEVE